MANNIMKQAASEALSYFAVVANTEQSEGRREFSRKAGSWIADAVEKLGGNGIVAKNITDAQERKNVLESQYDLASEALHPQNSFMDIIKEATKIGESDYHGGWNKLKETLKGRMDETSRLASDLDSLYSKQNKLLLLFAENELIGPAGGEEEIDTGYAGVALQYIGSANITITNPAQMAWGNEIGKGSPIYDRMDHGFMKAAEACAKKMNEISIMKNAIYAASMDALVAGKKVAREEFEAKVEEYKKNMSVQISSAIKQMEDAMKNPQLLTGADYKGQEFA